MTAFTIIGRMVEAAANGALPGALPQATASFRPERMLAALDA